jgi:hypothetical protein
MWLARRALQPSVPATEDETVTGFALEAGGASTTELMAFPGVACMISF